MCLALPAKIIRVDDDADTAEVDIDGVVAPISLALVDDAAPGDYVVVHVGYALSKIDPEVAAAQLAAMRASAQVDGSAS